MLVCDEVTGDVRSYNSSGWCHCEFTIASLGKQLHQYSSDCEPVRQRSQCAHLQEGGGLQAVADAFYAALALKTFVHESDREVACEIISRYAWKGRLVEAINSKDVDGLSKVLGEIARLQLRDLLEQPVDATQNTPLHLAVARGFAAGVGLLMQSGARLDLTNRYGDTPVQCCLMPRLCKAARMARNFNTVSTTSKAVSSEDGLAQFAEAEGSV